MIRTSLALDASGSSVDACAPELPHDARQFGQRLQQAPGPHQLLPAAAAQQAAHHVPARVLHQVAVVAEHRGELVHHSAALLPVLGKAVQRQRRGRLGAVAAVPVVDDQVQVEAQRPQHRLGERRLARAVCRAGRRHPSPRPLAAPAAAAANRHRLWHGHRAMRCAGARCRPAAAPAGPANGPGSTATGPAANDPAARAALPGARRAATSATAAIR